MLWQSERKKPYHKWYGMLIKNILLFRFWWVLFVAIYFGRLMDNADIKQFIINLDARLDRFEKNIEKTIQDIAGDTKGNLLAIATLQNEQENMKSDLNAVMNLNREQHKEYYIRLAKAENQLSNYKSGLALVVVLSGIIMSVLRFVV